MYAVSHAHIWKYKIHDWDATNNWLCTTKHIRVVVACLNNALPLPLLIHLLIAAFHVDIDNWHHPHSINHTEKIVCPSGMPHLIYIMHKKSCTCFPNPKIFSNSSHPSKFHPLAQQCKRMGFATSHLAHALQASQSAPAPITQTPKWCWTIATTATSAQMLDGIHVSQLSSSTVSSCNAATSRITFRRASPSFALCLCITCKGQARIKWPENAYDCINSWWLWYSSFEWNWAYHVMIECGFFFCLSCILNLVYKLTTVCRSTCTEGYSAAGQYGIWILICWSPETWNVSLFSFLIHVYRIVTVYFIIQDAAS